MESAYEEKFKKYIETIEAEFQRLQDKIIVLNKQKDKVPLTEDIQNDSKEHLTFFSIGRIPSDSQIPSINESVQELEKFIKGCDRIPKSR